MTFRGTALNPSCDAPGCHARAGNPSGGKDYCGKHIGEGAVSERPSMPPGEESLRVAAERQRAANDRLEATLGSKAFGVRLIYIAGPYTAKTRQGVDANIARAVALGIQVARLGAMPVIPHSNTAHPDFESVQPYQFWIKGTMALLHVCHAVIVTERWELSGGARGEVAEAEELCKPVFRTLPDLAKWLGAQGK